jgi:hypothetical protein
MRVYFGTIKDTAHGPLFAWRPVIRMKIGTTMVPTITARSAFFKTRKGVNLRAIIINTVFAFITYNSERRMKTITSRVPTAITKLTRFRPAIGRNG